MNQITITGRLTEEPKTTYSAGNEPVAHSFFNFAVPDMSMKKKTNRGIIPQISSDVPFGENLQKS